MIFLMYMYNHDHLKCLLIVHFHQTSIDYDKIWSTESLFKIKKKHLKMTLFEDFGMRTSVQINIFQIFNPFKGYKSMLC